MSIKRWMDNENVVHLNSIIPFSTNQEKNCGILRKIDRTGKYNTECGNPDPEMFSFMYMKF